MSTHDKQFYMAQEIGKLKGRVDFLEASNKHYRDLVGERTKALHGMKKENRWLKRELKVERASQKTGESR